MRVEIKELENLYKNAYNKDTDYFKLIRQYHWFYEVVEYDPKTRKPLPQSLSCLLRKINDKHLYYKTLFEEDNNISYNARFIYICNYCKEEIKYIIKYLNEFPKREHLNLYVSKVKELDVNCFIKLNEKPGKNIKQKLADKPYMYAVKHIQSVDLLENRLFKSFVIQLLDILQIRKKILKDENDIYCLIPIIKKWLLTNESKSILNLEKLIPNNTLISNKHYKTILDAWKELKEIDNNIKEDLKHVEENEKTIKFWSMLAQINISKDIKIADMPLCFNYDNNNFSIYSYMQDKIYLRKEKEVFPIKIEINNLQQMKPFKDYMQISNNDNSNNIKKIKEPICIDLANINPKWATTTQKGTFKENFIWQSWNKDNEKNIDITLFNSKAVDDRTNHTTIYLPDLFFSEKKYLDEENFTTATYSFTHKLQDYIDTITPFIWLVPDCLSFIDLELITKNINLVFSKAEPLPRSIAALFTRKYEYFSKCENKYIIVVDFINGKVCVTKFRVEQENKLQNLTHGKILVREKSISFDWMKGNICFIDKFDDNEKWINITEQQYRIFEEKELKEKLGIQENCNVDVIYITKEDIKDNILQSGGITLYELQKKAGEIALWRDNLPNLVTKVIVPNGYYDYVYFAKNLISKNNTLGTTEIFATPFKLNIKKGENIFPLYLEYDEKHSSTTYDAKLDSDYTGECELKIIYEYGKDFPYTLIFVPKNKNYKEIIAHWEKRKESNNIDVSNLPVPEFPPLDTWDKLENYPQKHDEKITENFLKKVSNSFDKIINDIYILNDRKFVGNLTFYMLSIWGSKSISDSDTPNWFKSTIEQNIKEIINTKINRKYNNFDELLKVITFLFSIMHKDAALHVIDNIISYINTKEYSNEFMKLRSIAYSFGDCSETWQHDLLKKLLESFKVSKDFKLKIKIITILSFAMWYRKNFVKNSSCIIKYYIKNILNIILNFKINLNNEISIKELNKDIDNNFFINNLSSEERIELIKDLIININNNNNEFKDKKRQELYKILERYEKFKYGNLFKVLELLYGLLILRNSEDKKLSQLFIPGNKMTNQLVDFIDEIIKQIIENNKKFTIKITPNIVSRIKIKVENKREELINVPDLLYALRVYLTNDDGANSISITEISQS